MRLTAHLRFGPLGRQPNSRATIAHSNWLKRPACFLTLPVTLPFWPEIADLTNDST